MYARFGILIAAFALRAAELLAEGQRWNKVLGRPRHEEGAEKVGHDEVRREKRKGRREERTARLQVGRSASTRLSTQKTARIAARGHRLALGDALGFSCFWSRLVRRDAGDAGGASSTSSSASSSASSSSSRSSSVGLDDDAGRAGDDGATRFALATHDPAHAHADDRGRRRADQGVRAAEGRNERGLQRDVRHRLERHRRAAGLRPDSLRSRSPAGGETRHVFLWQRRPDPGRHRERDRDDRRHRDASGDRLRPRRHDWLHGREAELPRGRDRDRGLQILRRFWRDHGRRHALRRGRSSRAEPAAAARCTDEQVRRRARPASRRSRAGEASFIEPDAATIARFTNTITFPAGQPSILPDVPAYNDTTTPFCINDFCSQGMLDTGGIETLIVVNGGGDYQTGRRAEQAGAILHRRRQAWWR